MPRVIDPTVREPYTVIVGAKVTPKDKALIAERADAEGLTSGAWMRRSLLEALHNGNGHGGSD